MNKQKIYQEIRSLAEQLCKNNTVYTRADLADALKKFGVGPDSIAISELVWEAYRLFNNDASIRKAFCDNDNKKSLVDIYHVDSLIDEGNSSEIFSLLQEELISGDNALKELDRSIKQVIPPSSSSGSGNLLNTIVGTKGVSDVNRQATAIFNGYSKLVSGYDDANSQIKYLIADFIKLREMVCCIYWKYATILTDAFGESVKVIAPELFDFDTIEWLDVHGMLQSIKLEYNRIIEKCSTLMDEISGSFSNAVQKAGSSYKASGSKEVGLMMAALNMVSHYMDASEKTSMMRQELLTLTNSVKHDVTLIKGDMGRLMVIYKSLNDLYIPQSEAFCRFSEKVFSEEWEQTTALLYSDSEIAGLKEKRDRILEEYWALEKEMSDNQMNISYYNSHIAECEQLLESLRPKYNEALYRKPSKPNILVNIITLGFAGKNYNRDIYDWNIACRPVVSRYADLETDVRLDSHEKTQHQKTLAENQKKYKKLKSELNRLNQLIMSRISVSKTTKMKILPHLEAVIKLLRLAKEIAESKLDSKITKTISITRQDTELSPEIRQNIHSFADAVRGVEQEEYETSQEGMMELQEDNSVMNLGEKGHEAFQNAINAFEAWSELKAMKERSAIAGKAYDDQLAKLQDSFRCSFSEIDNKSAVLQGCLRRMNLAKNVQELKEGLLALLGEDVQSFSDKDWDDFFKGQKTINI